MTWMVASFYPYLSGNYVALSSLAYFLSNLCWLVILKTILKTCTWPVNCIACNIKYKRIFSEIFLYELRKIIRQFFPRKENSLEQETCSGVGRVIVLKNPDLQPCKFKQCICNMSARRCGIWSIRCT